MKPKPIGSKKKCSFKIPFESIFSGKMPFNINRKTPNNNKIKVNLFLYLFLIMLIIPFL